MIYAHSTDEKIEAQGADKTCLSLTTGIQKLHSPTITGRLPKMSVTLSEGSMSDLRISGSVEKNCDQLIVQHPGKGGSWGSCPGAPI